MSQTIDRTGQTRVRRTMHGVTMISRPTSLTRPALLVALGALTLPGLAAAGPADMFGVGGRSQAMSGAATASAVDPFAAYYNMAGVGALHRKELAIGLQLGAYHLGDRGNCFDSSSRVGCSEPFYYQDGGAWEVQQLQYGYENPHDLQIGAAVPLHRKVTLGMAVALPVDVKYDEDGNFRGVGVRLARLQTLDPYLPHYTLYRNRANVFGIYAGLGAELPKGLRLGLGSAVASTATLNLTMQGQISATTVSSDGEETAQIVSALSPDMEMSLGTGSALIAGIQWDLGKVSKKLDGYALGASYRGETSVGVNSEIATDITITADLSEDAEPMTIPVQVTGIMMTLADFYTPRQASVGLQGAIGDNFTANFDLTWTQWSSYQLPIAQILLGETTSTETETTSGFVSQPFRTIPDSILFYDTFVPRLGLEQRLGPYWTASRMRGVDLAVRGGVAFEPNPIALQDSYTNLLNADRVSGSLGLGAVASNPFPGSGTPRPVSVDLFFQYHQLLPQVHAKNPAKFQPEDFNGTTVQVDGYPVGGQYVAKGSIVVGGVSASMKF